MISSDALCLYHLLESLADDLLQGLRQVRILEGHVDLPLGVAQHRQGGGGLGELVVGDDGHRRAGDSPAAGG